MSVFRAFFGIVALCATALAGARSPADGQDASLRIGLPAPPFLVDALDGGSITSNFHGQPAYINVFATWCSPCRRELPSILQQARQYRDRIAFLFVDEREPASTVKDFALQFGVGTPVAVDRGEFAATFGVQGLPESIFIDRRGVVQYVYRGTIPDSVLAAELSQLADGTSAAVAAR